MLNTLEKGGRESISEGEREMEGKSERGTEKERGRGIGEGRRAPYPVSLRGEGVSSSP